MTDQDLQGTNQVQSLDSLIGDKGDIEGTVRRGALMRAMLSVMEVAASGSQ
jgi:hypothetical protein